MVLAHQVQADVDTARRPRGGQHVTVVDEEHPRIELDPGEQLLEVVGERPVGGGPAPVQETGGRQEEGAGADGHQAGAGADAGQGGEGRRVRDGRGRGERVRRDDHGVRLGQRLRTVPGGDGQVRVGTHGPPVHACGQHLVAAVGGPQDPVGDAEFEGVHAVEGKDDHLVGAGPGIRAQPADQFVGERTGPGRRGGQGEGGQVGGHGRNVSDDDLLAIAPGLTVRPGSAYDFDGHP